MKETKIWKCGKRHSTGTKKETTKKVEIKKDEVKTNDK